MSARIRVVDGLPYVEATLFANDLKITLPRVLLDTGAALSTFRASEVEKLQVFLTSEDPVKFAIGIGGIERVVGKQVYMLQLDDLVVSPFMIYVSSMTYYPDEVQGAIGFDFLRLAGAQLNLESLTVTKE